MAGDWIKIEKATMRKPEILRIASLLKINRREAFTLCCEFWFWCDDQLTDCHAKNVTETMIDEVVGVTGFASALIEVDWLQARNGSLVIPNFDRHLSKSAKNRALSGKRQQKRRRESVAHESRSERDKCVTREEKRREEINIKSSHTTHTNQKTETGVCGDSARMTRKIKGEGEFGPDFEAFWNAYGNQNNRRAAERAWEDATMNTDPSVIIQAAVNQTAIYIEKGVERGRMKSPAKWLIDGGWDNSPERLRELLDSLTKPTKQPATIAECPI